MEVVLSVGIVTPGQHRHAGNSAEEDRRRDSDCFATVGVSPAKLFLQIFSHQIIFFKMITLV